MQEVIRPVAMIPENEFFERIEALIDSKLAAKSAAPAPPDDLPELMSREQAAEYLGCSRGSIDNYTRSGLLRKVYIGRLPRFKRDELRRIFDSWKDQGK